REVGEIAVLVARLDALATLYVADDDVAPKEAYTAGGRGRRAIHRTDTVDIPPNRERDFPVDFDYGDADYRYTVTLLGEGRIPDRPEGGPFVVVRKPPAISASAKGRCYTGDQGFFPNVAFWGEDRDPDGSVPAPPTRVRTERQGAITRFASAEAAKA